MPFAGKAAWFSVFWRLLFYAKSYCSHLWLWMPCAGDAEPRGGCSPPGEFVRTACWVCAHRAEFVRTACWVCAHRLLSLCAPCWVCAHCAEFVRSSPSQWIFQQRHEVADMWIHTSSKIFQFTFEIVTLATCNWFIQPSSLNWITPVRNMWRNFMVPGTMVAPFP